MLEIYTLTTATISTIVVVIMATLFFCCWRKKGSRDIAAGKNGKSGSTKEGAKADRSGSLTPSVAGRSENGVMAENQSPTNGETKLPLLSVTAYSDSNEDLGDFSAVQRETEILRSYRKPPPPKHRARQTRVPRLVKNGNDSSDIFTELNEEDFKNEDISDKENIVSYDNADTSVLRLHSEDKTKSPRDTRSSMLDDIEQALAALHMSDQSEGVETSDSPQTEDKTSTTEYDAKDHRANSVSDLTFEPYAGDFSVSENIISSNSQAIIFSEIQTESVSVNVASSPKQNHTVKPKTGPKVSPKPSPKFTTRESSYKDSTSVDAPVDIHKDTHDSNYVTANTVADNEGKLDPAVIDDQCVTSKEELLVSEIGIPKETSSCLQTLQKTADETSTVTEAEKLLDSTGSDTPSVVADIITRSKEDIVSECVVNESDRDKQETVTMSVMTKSSENPVTDKICDEDTIIDTDKSKATESAVEAEADSASLKQPESVTPVSASKRLKPSGDANDLDETVPSSTAQEVRAVLAEEATEQQTRQSVTETSSVEQEGSDGNPREEDKQQKDLAEDQTGKGKISKIPVRSEKI
ncbi:unnamed protein product [Candidula unifasciata]|uniref:Uncharacterized protein n=1 Tax=Candidula unifasciata TaxID=100452 RepID=A0A8S3ZYG9_9EUPU|nr:unnamed protein product [Candidula unifasciata]